MRTIQTIKYLTVLMACTMGTVEIHADQVTTSQAQLVAQKFFASHGLQTATTARNVRAPRYNNTNSVAAPYYVFTTGADNFVVVSGETGTPQILAYSMDCSFDADNLAPGAAFMLASYEEQIQALRNGAQPAPQAPAAHSEGLLLPTAQWNQSNAFWNSQCPLAMEQPTHAGCVPTAMAIIMRYYEWPKHGFGSHKYVTKSFQLEQEADFTSYDYDLASLPLGNEYDEAWDAEKQERVATLLHHCGVAVEVDYGPFQSGAWQPELALYRHFGYKLGYTVARNTCPDNQKWLDMIFNELDEGHPFMYHGSGPSESHVFICDGYDTDNNLHFNFGWSGTGNGYYHINEIIISDISFNYEQEATLGIRPDFEATAAPDADLFLKYSPTINSGLIAADSLYREGDVIPLNFYNIISVSREPFTGNIALFLCDAQGNRIGNAQYSYSIKDLPGFDVAGSYLPQGWMYATIPNTTPVGEGYQVRLFSQRDGSEEWKPINSSIDEAACINIDDLRSTTARQFEFQKIKLQNGLIKEGVECDERGNELTKGVQYIIKCWGVINVDVSYFSGVLGAFLCNAQGERKLELTRTNPFYVLYTRGSNWTIPINIPISADVEPTDYIGFFTRLNTSDEWVPVYYKEPIVGIVPVNLEAWDQYIPVRGIQADDIEAQYFTIGGARIDGRPQKPGLYIMQHNGQSRKVMLR